LTVRRLLPSVSAPLLACASAVLLLSAPQLQGSPNAARAATAGRAAAPAMPPQAAYAITPSRRALLNTIRYAEGTWKQGSREGYHTLYGGGHFASLARHPEIVVRKRYTSAAAGAYQFLPGTWKEASRRLQLESFDPASQDQAALYLIDRRGVLKTIDKAGLTSEAMAVLAREWASFPTLSGESAYGQPVKRAEELVRFYRSNLEPNANQA
jgi:lysozyme